MKKEYEFDKALFHKMDSIIDNCIRHCHNKHFHTFVYKYVNDIKLTKICDDEIVNLTIADKNINLCELNEKLKRARQRGFILNKMLNLTIKFIQFYQI